MRSNPNTCLPGTWAPTAAPPLAVAYSIALAAERAREDVADGYRLYWLASGRFGSCDVPLDGFVVVGRHALCDAVLDADPTIALRHLLVRASRLDDGMPRLAVLDLHTNLGFSLDGGRNANAIAATGALAFHVGAYAVVALPGGEPPPEELPAARVVAAEASHPYREARGAPSSITLLPRAPFVGESWEPGHACSTVSLTSARASATVRVSPLDLELGVLVGRAPKCNGVLRTVLNDGISRVHLLLRRDVAYDLSSTQGTFVNGARVRKARLEESVIVQLGTVSPVYLRVTPLARAATAS